MKGGNTMEETIKVKKYLVKVTLNYEVELEVEDVENVWQARRVASTMVAQDFDKSTVLDNIETEILDEWEVDYVI